MQKTYLVELVSALDADLRDEFELFITTLGAQPGKRSDEMLRLLQIISSALGSGDDTILEKTSVYRALFPGKPVVTGKLEKLMVDLSKQLRRFLLFQFYLRGENEFTQQYDFGIILKNLGLESRYLQQLAKLQVMQDQCPGKNALFYFQQFQLEYARYEFESFHNTLKDDLNIPNVVNALDVYYHLQRLEQLNHFLLQRKMTQSKTADGLEFALENINLPEKFLKESSVLLINYHIFILLKKPDPTPEDFDQLEHLLREHEPHIEKADLEKFYTYLRSTCVLLINSGAEYLRPILHRIQRDNLERGYLYLAAHEGNLTPSACLNLVNVALNVHNFEWVHDFLEQHKDRIYGDNETRDYYRLNNACYLFAIGAYEEALDYIPAMSQSVDYHTMARRLEIKIYYEQDSDLLPFKLDAYKMYISRASQKFLSPELRLPNNDFVNCLLQIMQSVPGDKKRSEQIVKRIEGKKGVAERRWLLEKARQLGGM